MINIKHISQITKFSDSNYAYLYVPTFELWYEMYKQIIKSDRVQKGNKDCWYQDWELGIDYIKAEFNKRRNGDGFVIVSVRMDTFGELKFALTIRPPKLHIKYQLVINEYSVEII